ncbi:MAG TPA: DUF4126 domain-containing protein [Chloroflexota bacterium]|nr:DUF4126 domain-containing protein [Chloroflexota bacterium]
MDPLLLGTASAFGLAAATGLNSTLPLLIVGLTARFGLLTLVAPYDAVASDVALIGLGILALGEIAADKIPGADTIVHLIQGPLTMAAGAILFASQSSMIQDVSPGLAILVGLLTAGGVHTLRAIVRPVVTIATMGLGGPVVSTAEDVGAVGLTVTALVAPILAVGALIAMLAIGGRLAVRRFGSRPQPVPYA